MRIAIFVSILGLVLAPMYATAATFQTGSLPAEFGGGILVSRDTFLAETEAALALEKLRLAVEKCYARGADNVSRGKPSNVAPCLHDPVKGSIVKYQATLAKIAAKRGGLPPCAGFVERGTNIAELTRAFFAWSFCGDPPDLGSPSGAFVDGAPAL
jgi:hypothetical protein